ncbi:MAG: hypothetical protein ABIR03_12015 [Ginsengibacter sp.]
MKRIILMLMISIAFFTTKSDAQIQRGNFMIGGDLANLNLTLGGGGAFQVRVDPKLAFFLRDNVALGVYINFGLATAKGAGTTTDYGVGALGRYYINDSRVNIVQQGRLFFEGNAGIQGISLSGGSNTTGLGLGIGPGYAYFITQNIGLETLLKYNGIVGFGSQAYRSNLNLGIGFQIYLRGSRARQIIDEVK